MIKNILILYKQSTYRHFFLKSGKANPFGSHPIIRKFVKTHHEHFRTLRALEKYLRGRGVRYTKVLRGSKKDFSAFDLIITVGGDGTFLEGASRVHKQWILGINSDPTWSVGRFCVAAPGTFSEILDRVFDGRAKVSRLNRMAVSFSGSAVKSSVLNDILICHSNPAAMSRYDIRLGAIKEEQRSSGIWVSTAAGSSGAVRSAGGHILPETSRSLQYVVRELYRESGKKQILSSGLIPSGKQLIVTSLMKDGIVYLDGSHVSRPFPFGVRVTVRNAPVPLNVVVP